MSSENVTFCVCTYNSEKLLAKCLASIQKVAPSSPILVVDHRSKDATEKIARAFGAKILREDVGLGHARQVCFDNVSTEFIAFVDSDVEILQRDFLTRSLKVLDNQNIGA
ncbi:MAG: glycosyltransferase family 2 protein, partial [Thaumarchaeota archaeon]|nr:glycosyltransferase family 2 protein [Nitrososphaerota archaeon]